MVFHDLRVFSRCGGAMEYDLDLLLFGISVSANTVG